MTHVARLATIIATALALSPSAPAPACPTCAEGVRAQVRREVFDDRFGRHLLAAASPFVVLLGITAAIHGRPDRRASGRGEEGT